MHIVLLGGAAGAGCLSARRHRVGVSTAPDGRLGVWLLLLFLAKPHRTIKDNPNS